MSFTGDIKQEIANYDLKKHCQKAQLSALLLLTSSITLGSSSFGLAIRSENPTTAKRIVYLLKELFAVDTNLEVNKKTNLKKNNVYRIRIKDRGQEILEELGLYSNKGINNYPRHEIITRNCCASSYLAGLFLAYGSCNSPLNNNYHLEITLNSLEHANFATKVISRFDIKAKIVKRRNRYIIYMKKADYISNFLALIGAHDSMMRFEDERIGRDLKNSISRIDNCEIANEVKTFKAAQKQLANIQLIKDNGEYDKLNDKLKNVIDIRLKHQDYSLLELCDAYQKSYGELISKSGMKHRLNKIEKIASEIGVKNG